MNTTKPSDEHALCVCILLLAPTVIKESWLAGYLSTHEAYTAMFTFGGLR